MSALINIIKIIICSAFFVGTQIGFAQNSISTLIFDNYEWNIGYIREIDGEVSRSFSFTNSSDKPISIERVKVDCGCTVPKYDNKPIAPGDKGIIEISFNPAKYSGAFNRRVTIYSNEGSNRNVITVKGSVEGRPRSIEDDYPFELGGGIRAAELHKAFGYIERGSTKSMVASIINTSPGTAIISTPHTPTATPGFSVVAPTSLASGEKADITLTYDFTTSPIIYGMLADRVLLSVNGTSTELPINANAIGVDNFSKTNLFKAPKCEISPIYHNFKEVKSNSSHMVNVSITNKGKSPLIIRDVSLRRNTKCQLIIGTKIAAGQTMTIPITLEIGASEYGTITGGVTIVVNDPERPFREIRVGAEVY